MQQPAPFLILDDDDVFAQTLARALTRRGFAPQIAHTGGEALALARQTRFSYVTVDLHLAASDKGLMPHGGTDSGLHWIAPLRQALPDARMLILLQGQRVRDALTWIEALTKLGAEGRLAERLLLLAESRGRREVDGVRIDVQLSQETVAELIGTTRQRVNQIFSQWQVEGLIRRNGRNIILADLDRLKKYVDLA